MKGFRKKYFNMQLTDHFFFSEGIVAPPRPCCPGHWAKLPDWRRLENKAIVQKGHVLFHLT